MISLILGLHDVICFIYIYAFMIHEERTAVVAFAFRPNPEGLILQHNSSIGISGRKENVWWDAEVKVLFLARKRKLFFGQLFSIKIYILP